MDISSETETRNNMKSANQLYKASKSNKPFKEWINEQKRCGKLTENNENQEVMYQNATDEASTKIQVFGIDVKYIAIGVLVLGAVYVGYRYWKKRQ